MSVPYEVVRRWTVLGADPGDAVARALPGEHHDVSVHRMPCGDWPAPCTHDPVHVRPSAPVRLPFWRTLLDIALGRGPLFEHGANEIASLRAELTQARRRLAELSAKLEEIDPRSIPEWESELGEHGE